MSAYRVTPVFGKTTPSSAQSKPGEDSTSCVWLLLVGAGSYVVLSAISRVTSHAGSRLDQLICYGALIGLVILLLLGTRDSARERKLWEAEKKSWVSGCKTALLTIVNRQEADSWWDDYSNRYHYTPHSLELEMSADQKAVSPTQATVCLEVSQAVFEHLKERDATRIYYQPDSPLTFLLEEEI